MVYQMNPEDSVRRHIERIGEEINGPVTKKVENDILCFQGILINDEYKIIQLIFDYRSPYDNKDCDPLFPLMWKSLYQEALVRTVITLITEYRGLENKEKSRVYIGTSNVAKSLSSDFTIYDPSKEKIPSEESWNDKSLLVICDYSTTTSSKKFKFQKNAIDECKKRSIPIILYNSMWGTAEFIRYADRDGNVKNKIRNLVDDVTVVLLGQP